MARKTLGSDTQLRQLANIAAAMVCMATLAGPAQSASREDRVFTIGNYPVEARASDAVAAKEKAIADGQQAAFRSLLKRLVPVTAYQRLGPVKSTNASGLIESFAVRSERNSSTDYIASYDFVFSANGVRKVLDAQRIPYLDRQAPSITIVPAYRAPKELAGKLPPTFAAATASDAWLYAWKALDLGNSLTPATLQAMKAEIHADTISGLAEGDLSHLRTVASEYRTETVVVAILEPEADLKRLKVTLAGRDAVQTIVLKRFYRMQNLDLAYTAELAAVLSLAILEGRWKAINARDSHAQQAAAYPSHSSPPPAAGTYPATTGGSDAPLTIAVEFRGMAEWQQISRALSQTPEISGLDVLGLSAQGARVQMRYPAGPERLALALASQGLILQNARGGWVLTRR